MKNKISFLCTECGYTASKWLGKCPDCGAWNSFEETVKVNEKQTSSHFSAKPPISLDEAGVENVERFSSGIKEFDRILGGGIVDGSFTLLGGAPGIGKSTLLLQLSFYSQKKVLYISGEESISQIKSRANRLKINSQNIFLLATDNLNDIKNAIDSQKPEILIIDSIQTIYNPEILNSSGTISQIKDVASHLLRIAKTQNITIFLIGHITKEGNLAGPKILEHIVDVVLYFEDEKGVFRIIRSFKNRFGSTSEIAVFEMTSGGLCEVKDPEKIFFDENISLSSGMIISTVVEGTRAINVELQALVSRNFQGIGRRQTSGLDINRLFFLIAVLEKKLKLKLYDQDIFLNLVGGLKIKDIALDLAICASIISSYLEIVIPKDIVFIGEVGLGGEIRPVSFLQERLNRTQNFGIKTIILPTAKNLKIKDANLIFVDNITAVSHFIKSLK